MSLLPPNATPLELALESAFERISSVPLPVDTLWDPASCPVAVLPWLAWQLRADWNDAWPESVQRQVCADAIKVHKRRGTIGAVRLALTAADYAPDQIEEGRGQIFYDGSFNYDGSRNYRHQHPWAEYSLLYDLDGADPMSLAELEDVRQLAEGAGPARSALGAITYSEEPVDESAAVSDGVPTFDHIEVYRYNGAHNYDGSITYSAGLTTAEVWA